MLIPEELRVELQIIYHAPVKYLGVDLRDLIDKEDIRRNLPEPPQRSRHATQQNSPKYKADTHGRGWRDFKTR